MAALRSTAVSTRCEQEIPSSPTSCNLAHWVPRAAPGEAAVTLRQRVLAIGRRSNRTVLLTYPGLGVGNYLYFALRAYLLSGEGRDYRVTLDDGVRPWLAVMPALQSYFVEHSDVRLLERREHISPSF